MTTAHRDERGRRARRSTSTAACLLLALGLAACGGDGSNPIGNPPEVSNPVGVTGQKLSFAYFQKCINPIFVARLQINIGGAISTNTCAGSGCHDNTTGTGGALRVVANAQPVDLTDPANTPEVIRAVCHKELPGFGEQMRAASLRAGVPTAILSRQTAAILDRTLVVTLPGKPASIRVCLDAVFPAIPYCIDLLGGPRLEGNPAVVQVFRPKAK